MKKNKLNIALIILIIIVAILVVLELATGIVSKGFNSLKHSFFRLVGIESREGNSTGNINNYGYITEDNKYLYYMCPVENGKYVGIAKVNKKDLTGSQTILVKGTWELTSINSYGDYIYFVTLSQNEVDENDEKADEVDNKIHRVSKSGDQKDEILNDNDFHNYDYKMVVVDGKIYYIGKDECIWYMDLDGKNKKKLNNNKTGFEAINDKYILCNMPKVKDEENTSVSYIMDRNGKNPREINGGRIYNPVLYKDFIFYLTAEGYIHRVDLDGKNDIMLSDSKTYCFNVTEDGVFYIDFVYSSDGEPESIAIFKMDFDGKNSKKIYDLNETVDSFCVINDWVFTIDTSDECLYMNLISSDGKQTVNLLKLNYSDYYYLEDLLEERKNEISEGKENTLEEDVNNQVENNNVSNEVQN